MTRGSLRGSVLAAASTCALAGPAYSQTSQPATPTSQARQAPPSAATGVGEIIVTAQRRDERLRDVPISITTQTAEQLDKAHVTNLADLTYTVPGVEIDDAGQFVQPAIRGISTTVVGNGTNQPIGIYLDGVYQPNMLANHFEFADLARIEVDKGPQGTLYGRNATGGAIAIFTKTPSFTPTGDFALGYGNFNDVLANAFISGPIYKDKIAASLSVYYERHDDYAYNVATRSRAAGLDSKIARGKLLYTPAGGVKFTLTAGYTDRTDTDSGDEIPLHGNSVGAQDPSAIITTKPHYIAQNVQSHLHLKETYLTLNGRFDLGIGTLTSITSGQYAWTQTATDDDHTYNPTQKDRFVAGGDVYIIYEKNHTFAEDLSFASRKWGGFSFLAGAAYYFNDDRTSPLFGLNSTQETFAIYDYQPDNSYDGFFEGTYELTDRLVLTAGVRYTYEHSENYGSAVLPGCCTLRGTRRHVSFSDATPRASVRYNLANDTNVYFTYSTGFKAGGLAATAFFMGTPSFSPETVTSYEVGVKSRPSSRLSFNASAFYYDYANIQMLQSVFGQSQIITNAASARLYGLDADATIRLTDEFTIAPSVELLNAQYVSYKNADALVPQFGSATDPIPGAPAGNMLVVVDASGKEMPRAPDVTFALNADYKRKFSSGTLDVSATVYYSGRFYFDNIQRISQSAYATLNGRISWQPASSKFRYEIWGKNVTNTTYIASVFEDSLSDGAAYAPPATLGVTIKYSF